MVILVYLHINDFLGVFINHEAIHAMLGNVIMSVNSVKLHKSFYKI